MYIQSKDIVIQWSQDKNQLLKATRKIGFEEIEKEIIAGRIINIIYDHNPTKYPGQNMLHVIINNYVYAVPYVTTTTGIFLKTIYPNRKETKKYKNKGIIL